MFVSLITTTCIVCVYENSKPYANTCNRQLKSVNLLLASGVCLV